MKETTIQVVINGTVILETATSEAEDMDNTPLCALIADAKSIDELAEQFEEPMKSTSNEELLAAALALAIERLDTSRLHFNTAKFAELLRHHLSNLIDK